MNLFKWAGGKGALLPRILPHLDRPVLVEPFAGSAAVSLAFLRDSARGHVIITDSNPRVVEVWHTTRDAPQALADALERLPRGDGWWDEYPALRDRFNAEIREPARVNAERAALFLWLNRAGFNGLYRVNAQGRYNVPVGTKRVPLPVPSREDIAATSSVLRRASIGCVSWRDMLAYWMVAAAPQGAQADVARWSKRTAVYADPPYLPLSDTAKFTEYTSGGWSREDTWALVDTLANIAEWGGRVVLSNHADPELIERLEKAKFNVEKFPVKRTIGVRVRAPVEEILAWR